ncbi:hypothetical protein B0J11DRAFT_313185 [Dendryphion nanum]|uniref:Uncharacterized protein n=1 Tax=Dendryphion nanum TaxID=256645 RepID=A0A9P9DU32_9PLEO|nr:hypothetical protein B0J11DRAFT_313185 [Dendryphion nanum]
MRREGVVGRFLQGCSAVTLALRCSAVPLGGPLIFHVSKSCTESGSERTFGKTSLENAGTQSGEARATAQREEYRLLEKYDQEREQMMQVRPVSRGRCSQERCRQLNLRDQARRSYWFPRLSRASKQGHGQWPQMRTGGSGKG